MKTVLFGLLMFGINTAFAAPLVEEAICTGTIDGEEMKFISLVNPMDWCEDTSSSSRNAVIFFESSFTQDVPQGGVRGLVATATISNPSQFTAVVTSSTSGVVETIMSYAFNDTLGTIELLGENGVFNKYELQCVFPQWTVNCER